MNERVKQLLKELGGAISDAVSSDDRVDFIMQAIRDEGYDAHLLLEATIAIGNKQFQLAPEKEFNEKDLFTFEDRKFLRRLKIEI